MAACQAVSWLCPQTVMQRSHVHLHGHSLFAMLRQVHKNCSALLKAGACQASLPENAAGAYVPCKSARRSAAHHVADLGVEGERCLLNSTLERLHTSKLLQRALLVKLFHLHTEWVRVKCLQATLAAAHRHDLHLRASDARFMHFDLHAHYEAYTAMWP